MLVSRENILHFIPQRAPMVMVDGLMQHTADISVSFLKIEADNIFVSGGFFQMPGLVENIAQTAALRNGYDFKVHQQHDVGQEMKSPVGFIGEVKNLIIHFLPAIGDIVKTKVTLLHTIFAVSVVKGTVICRGDIAAECEMKIFVQG